MTLQSSAIIREISDSNLETEVLTDLTEKSGWGVESIMVSDFQFTAELPHPLQFESKNGANLYSASQEPRRNREIGKW